MAGKKISAASRSAPAVGAGDRGTAPRRGSVDPNREGIMAELMDVGDANTPPTDEEILSLILGEIAFLRMNRSFPPLWHDLANGR